MQCLIKVFDDRSTMYSIPQTHNANPNHANFMKRKGIITASKPSSSHPSTSLTPSTASPALLPTPMPPPTPSPSHHLHPCHHELPIPPDPDPSKHVHRHPYQQHLLQPQLLSPSQNPKYSPWPLQSHTRHAGRGPHRPHLPGSTAGTAAGGRCPRWGGKKGSTRWGRRPRSHR